MVIHIYDIHTMNDVAYLGYRIYAIVQAGQCTVNSAQSRRVRGTASLERGPVRATFEVHQGLPSKNACVGTLYERVTVVLLKIATLKL